MFWMWIRTQIAGHPVQLFWGVRAEVKQTAEVIFDVFMDSLSGDDGHYGYDYRKKIEMEAIEDYNHQLLLMNDGNRQNGHRQRLKFKKPSNVKILEDFEKQ